MVDEGIFFFTKEFQLTKAEGMIILTPPVPSELICLDSGHWWLLKWAGVRLMGNFILAGSADNTDIHRTSSYYVLPWMMK